jgi:hypothetical protein
MTDFVDANCITGKVQRPEPWSPTDALQTKAILDRFSVADALIVDSEACEYDFDAGNERVLKSAAATGYRPVWGIPLHAAVDFEDGPSFTEAMARNRVGCVRLTCTERHGYTVDEWSMGPLWDALNDARVPVLVANSDMSPPPDVAPHGISPGNLYEIAKRYSRIPFVVLRLSGFSTRVAVPLMRQLPNVYAEISYFTVHRGVEYLSREIGAERLVYGSGLPWGSPGPGILSVMYADISDEQRTLIAGRNILALLDRVAW